MLAAVWAIVVALTGGFFIGIGPVRVSSRNPRDALGVAVLAAIVAAGLSWRPEGRRALREELLRVEAFGVACAAPLRRYPKFCRTPARQAALWLLLVWAVSAVYIYPFVDRGWVPHDEGLLGQSAERVLSGQLPHRDFDETYTGGLSYLHAVAFKLAGVRLISLRYALLVFFLAWIPALFAIARRLTSPPAAALATLLAVMWGMPNYFASMPSWYNLIFATFGIAAIMKYVDGGGRWWLFAAGAAGGASFAIKSTAIYYLVGATLFLTTRELVESAVSTPGSRSYAMLGAKAAVAVLVTIAAIVLVRSHWALPEFAHFIVPIAAASALSCWVEALWGSRAAPGRVRRLAGTITPFALGILLPLAVLVIPYELSGSVSDLWRGLFITPQRRLAVASAVLPSSAMLLPVVPYVAVLAAPAGLVGWRGFRWLELTVVLYVTALLAWADRTTSYQILWNLTRHLNIAAALGAAVALWRVTRRTWPPSVKTQAVLLLVTVTAFATLIEFPFSAPIYFCYVAPLVALTILGAIELQGGGSKRFHLAMALLLMAFAVCVNRGYLYAVGFLYQPYQAVNANIVRAGLRIPDDHRVEYSTVLGLVNAHATGEFIYATPDCPEIYFLSGFRNPTRTFYEAFDEEPMTAARLLDLIDRRAITVVVINLQPEFSPGLDVRLEQALTDRFPHAATAGRFMVRWAE